MHFEMVKFNSLLESTLCFLALSPVLYAQSHVKVNNSAWTLPSKRKYMIVFHVPDQIEMKFQIQIGHSNVIMNKAARRHKR